MSQISRSLKAVKKGGSAHPKLADKLQNVQNGKPPAITTKKTSTKTSVKPSRRSRSVDQPANDGQTQITDYFQRRSSRKVEAQSKMEQQAAMEKRIIDGSEDGLKVEFFEDKGRGIIASRPFKRGEYVVEYFGEHISVAEASKREKQYAEDPTVGCYMLYFNYKGRRFCVDATSESGRLGRLLNHKRNGNCVTKAILFPQDSATQGQKKSGRTTPEEHPRVILVANRDISAGEELLYDYGDRSPDSIASHPWLAS